MEAVRSSQPADRVSLREAPPFSLGRLTVLLLAFLVFSGFGLLLFYEPTAEGAATSLARLHIDRPLGWLIHNTHRWSALLLIAFMVLHAARVVVSRAYRAPRDLNWWLGLSLLLLIMGMGATGYLLRWDIKAFTLMDLFVTNFSEIPLIGPTIIRAMLGGAEPDRVPLYRGFAFHVWVIPLILAIVLGTHLLIAWRQGLADQPVRWQRWKSRLPYWRWINWLPGIGLLVLVAVLAAITPHEGTSGPVDRSAVPHPDWIMGLYFLPFWYFGQSTQVVGAVVFPVALFAFLIVLPRIAHSKARPWIAAALAGVAIVGVVLLFGQTSLMGYQVPSQGCAACHQPGILGGAPTTLSEFEIRDAEWLVFHLREPELSILTPSDPPDSIP